MDGFTITESSRVLLLYKKTLEDKSASPSSHPSVTKVINIDTAQKQKMTIVWFNPDNNVEKSILNYFKTIEISIVNRILI